ncbi:hypothetical protein AAFC00_005718 [Neodothiora populina]
MQGLGALGNALPPLQIRHPHSRQGSIASHSRQGSVTGLQIRTDLDPATTSTVISRHGLPHPQAQQPHHPQPQPQAQPPPPPQPQPQPQPQPHTSTSSHNLDSPASILSAGLIPSNTTDLRRAISAASLNSALSPNAGMTSPALAAMLDITPLPSPIGSGELSPGPWKRVRSFDRRRIGSNERRPSTATSSGAESGDPFLSSHPQTRFHIPLSPGSPPKKVKGYGSLMSAAVEAQRASSAQVTPAAHKSVSHGRNRSISDFVPEQLNNIRPRNITMATNLMGRQPELPMHREQYLAAQRGLVTSQHQSQLSDPAKALPSPPPSNRSVTNSDMDDEDLHPIAEEEEEEPNVEYFHVRDARNPSRKRRWRAVRDLGQGTFSRVILATSQRLPPAKAYIEPNLDSSRLVAVKIVEHGPAGGADEERIEVSLKREVDILKSVSHPCIVQLKALEYTDDRALLVLTYCPGGDLFELASQKSEILTRPLVQRIFAEVLAAVRYLHEMGVVHRDLKLENVLVYPPAHFLSTLTDPRTHPHPIISLTDLGLSRRISPPPASPLLTTRCGSEDYAAPEILLGQPYDGRSTDAWALGVLLYALMEHRLPFDTPPGKPERSRVSHRVARCDWIWTRFGDEDGEWDGSVESFKEWRGGGEVVEGLLKKVRMGRKSLVDVEAMDWVKEGILLPEGAKSLVSVKDEGAGLGRGQEQAEGGAMEGVSRQGAGLWSLVRS